MRRRQASTAVSEGSASVEQGGRTAEAELEGLRVSEGGTVEHGSNQMVLHQRRDLEPVGRPRTPKNKAISTAQPNGDGGRQDANQ